MDGRALNLIFQGLYRTQAVGRFLVANLFPYLVMRLLFRIVVGKGLVSSLFLHEHLVRKDRNCGDDVIGKAY